MPCFTAPISRRLLAAGAALLAAAACGSSPAPGPQPRSLVPAAPSVSAAAIAATGGGATTSAPRPTKTLVIVEENHSSSEALASMPYLASLARTHGRSTGYHATTHPSLPNYLAMLGGSTFGVTDDTDPAQHVLHGPSAFDRAIAAGHSAKSYVEAMPASCALHSSGRYAVRHNPWTYFADAASRANCRRFDVPLGTTSSGALLSDTAHGTLPTESFVVPDLCHDAHDCSLQTADAWLKAWVPRILSGPDYRAGRLSILVTFDEDDRSAGNSVVLAAVAPRVTSQVSSASLTHYSVTRYFAELAGTAPLRSAASAHSLRSVFAL